MRDPFIALHKSSGAEWFSGDYVDFSEANHTTGDHYEIKDGNDAELDFTGESDLTDKVLEVTPGLWRFQCFAQFNGAATTPSSYLEMAYSMDPSELTDSGGWFYPTIPGYGHAADYSDAGSFWIREDVFWAKKPYNRFTGDFHIEGGFTCTAWAVYGMLLRRD